MSTTKKLTLLITAAMSSLVLLAGTASAYKGKRVQFRKMSHRGQHFCVAKIRAFQNSAVNQAQQGWKPFDMKKAHADIKGVHSNMMYVLNNKGTPPFQLIPMLPKGSKVQITGTGASEKHSATFTIKGMPKGGKLDAVLLMPTSAHGPCNPAELAKKQSHTVWVTSNGNATRPGSGTTMVVNGADSKGDWIKTVMTQIPLQKGTNHVFFDPYPGKTAGVGGFRWGREYKIDVQ